MVTKPKTKNQNQKPKTKSKKIKHTHTHTCLFTYTYHVTFIDGAVGPPFHGLLLQVLLVGEGHLVEAVLSHGPCAPYPHGGHLGKEGEGGEQVVDKHLAPWHKPRLLGQVQHDIGPLAQPHVLHSRGGPTVGLEPAPSTISGGEGPDLREK